MLHLQLPLDVSKEPLVHVMIQRAMNCKSRSVSRHRVRLSWQVETVQPAVFLDSVYLQVSFELWVQLLLIHVWLINTQSHTHECVGTVGMATKHSKTPSDDD